jgi:hypothetical protein
MDSSIRSLSKLAFANQDLQSEIVEIGGEEGVDPGSKIKDLCFSNLVLPAEGGDSSIVQ